MASALHSFQGLFPDNNLRDVPFIKLKGSGYLRGTSVQRMREWAEAGSPELFFHVSHACKLHMLALIPGIPFPDTLFAEQNQSTRRRSHHRCKRGHMGGAQWAGSPPHRPQQAHRKPVETRQN